MVSLCLVELLLFLFLGGLVSLIFFLLLFFLSSGKNSVSKEQISVFECGFDSKMVSRTPFSIHFVLFIVLFLFFDFELVLVLLLPVLAGFGLVSLFVVYLMIFVSFVLEETKMSWF